MSVTASPEPDLRLLVGITRDRERVLLLSGHLAPGDCLRVGRQIDEGASEAFGLLRDLDGRRDTGSSAPSRAIADDVLRYAKGSLRSAVGGISNFQARREYIQAIRENATFFLDRVQHQGKDVEAITSLAVEAIAMREITREMAFWHNAGRTAEINRQVGKIGKSFLSPVVKRKDLARFVAEVSNGRPYEAMTDGEKIDVLKQVIDRSGKAGTFGTAVKTLQGVVRPAQLALTVVLIAQDASEAWDPTRTVAVGAARLGLGVAAAWAGETVGLALVGALALGPVGGALVLLGTGYLAGKVLNDFVADALDGVLEELNPRIPAELRLPDWTPESFSVSLCAEMPSVSMSAPVVTRLTVGETA
ncbi:hypothetical protein [Methylobacterium sp. SyP6R]|uniref:hypothetical protein n=1 Tax=Methylobacterium sp. SyP6R TaxID=2718876 RepID=UPI001F2C7B86|nr:hypothetical protein [Methylobacterium sp. SyP6R]MCF4128997.1 hypothetical protein [Methylobacterium sp. SyP6R]